MRPISLILLALVFVSGCDKAYFPRFVNYTEGEVSVAIQFSDGGDWKSILPAGKGAWLGRKDVVVTKIVISQNDKTRILNQEDIERFGAARAYAIRSLDDIQKIK